MDAYHTERLKQLEMEKNALGIWANAKNTAFGKQVLEEFRRRREEARNLYSLIPAAHPDQQIMLIEAQHTEKGFAQLIRSIEDTERRKIELDKQTEDVHGAWIKSQRVSRERDIHTGETDDR